MGGLVHDEREEEERNGRAEKKRRRERRRRREARGGKREEEVEREEAARRRGGGGGGGKKDIQEERGGRPRAKRRRCPEWEQKRCEQKQSNAGVSASVGRNRTTGNRKDAALNASIADMHRSNPCVKNTKKKEQPPHRQKQVYHKHAQCVIINGSTANKKQSNASITGGIATANRGSACINGGTKPVLLGLLCEGLES
eukprot:3617745-Rhodomonas_salina.1